MAQDSTYTKKWEDGSLKVEGKFSGNKKNGAWKEWSIKGEITFVAIYEDDLLISKITKEYYEHTKELLYDEKYYSGELLKEHREYSYQNNNIYNQTNYGDSGNILSRGKILNDKKDGKWIEIDGEGIEVELKYDNGILDVKEIKEWKIKPLNNFEPITPTKENSIIKIYRPWVTNKDATPIILKINDVEIKLGNGVCLEYEIKEDGVYQLQALTDKTNIIKLDVKVGRTYYLKVDVDWKFIPKNNDYSKITKSKLAITLPNNGIRDFKLLISKNEN